MKKMLANSNPSVQKCGKCIVWSLPLHILVIHGSHEQEQPVVQSEPTCEEEAALLDFPDTPLSIVIAACHRYLPSTLRNELISGLRTRSSQGIFTTGSVFTGSDIIQHIFKESLVTSGRQNTM